MRRMILDNLRRATGTMQLRAEMQRLEAAEGEARAGLSAALEETKRLAAAPALARYSAVADFPLQNWWERSLWEPVVQLAVRDHVRPGDVAFDVGANAGAFAMQMSRQSGPRGVICAFEASPRIIGRTQHNLVNSGCNNVTLYHRAVWHRSGDVVHIAAGSHLNDRVEEGAGGVPVPTLALDDFIAATGLHPSFIKMDIEGAEFEALRGSARMIAETRPVMALEQAPDDMRCHALLVEAGYVAVDLGSYRQIRVGADFSNPTGVNNVLFIPGEGRDNEVFAGVDADGETVFRYHTYTAFMAECYRDWVVQLDRPGLISPFLRFLQGRDPSLVWRGVQVFRLPAFDAVAAPLIY